MIELAKTSTTIATPINDVFNYVSNMENYGHWFPGVVAIRSKNNLMHAAVGKTYVETLNLPDGECELTIEVDQCDTDHLFITKGDLAGVLPQMTVMFSSDEENNCLITLQYHSRNTSLTEKSDIVIALKEDLTVRAEIGIARLKEILES